MNSTQLISFFIAHHGLHDRSWDPFLASLPESFDEHPMMWIMESAGSHAQLCLSLLPRQTQHGVGQVYDRFMKDMKVMKTREVILQKNRCNKPTMTLAISAGNAWIEPFKRSRMGMGVA